MEVLQQITQNDHDLYVISFYSKSEFRTQSCLNQFEFIIIDFVNFTHLT